jgi:hypothetical protein
MAGTAIPVTPFQLELAEMRCGPVILIADQTTRLHRLFNAAILACFGF